MTLLWRRPAASTASPSPSVCAGQRQRSQSNSSTASISRIARSNSRSRMDSQSQSQCDGLVRIHYASCVGSIALQTQDESVRARRQLVESCRDWRFAQLSGAGQLELFASQRHSRGRRHGESGDKLLPLAVLNALNEPVALQQERLFVLQRQFEVAVQFGHETLTHKDLDDQRLFVLHDADHSTLYLCEAHSALERASWQQAFEQLGCEQDCPKSEKLSKASAHPAPPHTVNRRMSQTFIGFVEEETSDVLDFVIAAVPDHAKAFNEPFDGTTNQRQVAFSDAQRDHDPVALEPTQSPQTDPLELDPQDDEQDYFAPERLSSLQLNDSEELDTLGLLSLSKTMISSLQDIDSQRGIFPVMHVDLSMHVEVGDLESRSSLLRSSSCNRTENSSFASISSETKSKAPVSMSSSGSCYRCAKRIGSFYRFANTCASCDRRFCKDHCREKCVLESLALLSGAKAKKETSKAVRVCADCFVRQELLSCVKQTCQSFEEYVDAGGLVKLIRWKYFSQQERNLLEEYIDSQHAGVLTLLAALFKYSNHPFMYVVVLAQFVKEVELNLDVIDFFWPQLLQWGFVHCYHAPQSVQCFYLLFIAAVCRRSIHLALKTTWESIAAHGDAMANGEFDRSNGIVKMLFFATYVSFGEKRGSLHTLLFENAPTHQQIALRDDLQKLAVLCHQLYEVTRDAAASTSIDCSWEFFDWLTARSEVEIEEASMKVRQRVQRKKKYFLDPFPTEVNDGSSAGLPAGHVETAHMQRQRRGLLRGTSDSGVYLDRIALRIFSSSIHLVGYLVDMTMLLKQSVPRDERKQALPSLLESLQDDMRREAYIPLVSAESRRHEVLGVIETEGTVFSTKERAPTMVFLETGDAKCPGVVPSSWTSFAAPGGPCDSGYLQGAIPGMFLSSLLQSTTADDEPVRDGMSVRALSGASSGRGSPTAVAQDFDETEEEANSIGSATPFERDDEGEEAPCGGSLSDEINPDFFFGERYACKVRRIHQTSSNSGEPGWQVRPLIAKSFDDMRQEVFVLQALRLVQQIFQKHQVDLYLHFYRIMCAGRDCGLLEVIVDAQSLDALKKKKPELSFAEIFRSACCSAQPADSCGSAYETARRNFISSAAAYSIFSYAFQVKDRHNGNILLDRDGHLIHIDFGFVLGIAPGQTFSLETAPFKLTKDMMSIIGPPDSEGFELFKSLVGQGIWALSQEATHLLALVSMTAINSSFPCFKAHSRSRIMRKLQQRLCVGFSREEVDKVATRLINKSLNHLGTRQYDWFQYKTNGIAR